MTQTGTTTAPMLTSTTEVHREIALIAKAVRAGDFTSARILETRMTEGVLEAIASGNAQAGWLAAAALESRAIEFPRG